MNADRILARHQAAAWRRVAGEMILLQPEQEKLLGINGTGAAVWELLDGKRSAAAIAHDVALRFARDEQAVLKDVLAFLDELEKRQLVVPVV
jgi:pyrroloquinoline quinone biosynthesis protein D